MVRVLQTLALVGAVSAVACGATTRNPEPVFVPQSSSGATQTAPAGPTEVNDSQRGVVPAGQ